MKAVIIKNLSKTYNENIKALTNVSLELDEGEVFGFLGPNGAGKTTTVKLLNGMLNATNGSCTVLNIDPATNPKEVHQLTGVVTEHAQMYNNLTGIQNLIFYGATFGLTEKTSKERGLALLEKLELADAKDRKLATYSTGMRQRLSLARCLIHNPKVLFLDEPTSGLDPKSTLTVNHFLRNLAKDMGVTIFLCTHQLRYAQEICTRYGLIEKGELIALGNLEELRNKVATNITVKIKATNVRDEEKYSKTEYGEFEMQVKTEEEIPSIIREIVNGGGNIYNVTTILPSLEDIYFALTAKQPEESR